MVFIKRQNNGINLHSNTENLNENYTTIIERLPYI